MGAGLAPMQRSVCHWMLRHWMPGCQWPPRVVAASVYMCSLQRMLIRMPRIARARGVVVSHPLSMREALGSIPSVSICNLANCLPRKRRLAWAPSPAVGPASVDTSAFVHICCACGSAARCSMSVSWAFRLNGCLRLRSDSVPKAIR